MNFTVFLNWKSAFLVTGCCTYRLWAVNLVLQRYHPDYRFTCVPSLKHYHYSALVSRRKPVRYRYSSQHSAGRAPVSADLRLLNFTDSTVPAQAAAAFTGVHTQQVLYGCTWLRHIVQHQVPTVWWCTVCILVPARQYRTAPLLLVQAVKQFQAEQQAETTAAAESARWRAWLPTAVQYRQQSVT